MPPGYDALRDVLASANTPTSPTLDRSSRGNNELSAVVPATVAAAPAPAPPVPVLASPQPPPQRASSKAPILYYNPVNRRTQPTSVLVPLTPSELESFKTPRHALRTNAKRHPCDPSLENPNFFPSAAAAHQDLLKKRKRKGADHTSDTSIVAAERYNPDVGGSLKGKRSGDDDTGIVTEHYNSRPDVGVAERRESPIIGLKNFNNWIKSVLIGKFAKLAFDDGAAAGDKAKAGGVKGKVLDMGCGKGGDLQKWSKARIAEYVGVDIAAVSIEQARARWLQMRGKRFDAQFAALDCYTDPITSAFPAAVFDTPFDVVSMQFCMHYAFETAAKAHMMLQNVAKYLRPGGIFLGTVPNGQWLLDRLAAIPSSSPPSFGNSVYNIRFEKPFQKGKQPLPVFGHRYSFFLKDAVEDVPEYVVHWEHFEKLARDYGLHLLYKEEFHDIFEAEKDHKEYGPLLQRMKVVTADGESQMDEDQWEAANIYLGFVFQKG